VKNSLCYTRCISSKFITNCRNGLNIENDACKDIS